jgi:GLPGLI family protein
MKKAGILALIIFAQIFHSQSVRFVYQATAMPDSTDLKSVRTEIANLDIIGNKSIFYGDSRLKRDSIIQRMRATKTFDRSLMENLRSNVSYVIEKDLLNRSTTYKDRVGRDQYAYTEKEPMVWKVLPETMKIDEYKVQKAETNYGGRTWYAWFTMDLPYQDGPYKFSGLPGLIVKVQDKNEDYSFDLIQVKKITEFPTFQNFGQDIAITRDKFLAIKSKFQSDPESYMQAQRNSGGGGFGGGNRGEFGGGRGGDSGGGRGNRGGGGSGSGGNTDMQEMRQKMLQDIKSNNNPIELK